MSNIFLKSNQAKLSSEIFTMKGLVKNFKEFKYPSNPINETSSILDFFKECEADTDEDILLMVQSLGIPTYAQVKVVEQFRTTIGEYYSFLSTEQFLIGGMIINGVKDVVNRSEPMPDILGTKIVCNYPIPTNNGKFVIIKGRLNNMKPAKKGINNHIYSSYDSVLLRHLLNAVANSEEGSNTKTLINIINSFYKTAETHCYGKGFARGLVLRLKEMNDVNKGIGKNRAPMSLKEMGISMIEFIELLRATYPIGSAVLNDDGSIKEVYIEKDLIHTTDELFDILNFKNSFIKPKIAELTGEGKTDERLNYVDVSRFLTQYYELWDEDLAELPMDFEYKPEAKAGLPYNYDTKKKDVLLDALRNTVSMVLDYDEVKNEKQKIGWMKKYTWSYCNYIFPKDEVYTNENLLKPRAINSSPFSVVLAAATLLQPLGKIPVVNNTSSNYINHTSLYKFNPFNGGIDRFLKNIVAYITMEIIATPETYGITQFIYADNIYVVTWKLPDKQKAMALWKSIPVDKQDEISKTFRDNDWEFWLDNLNTDRQDKEDIITTFELDLIGFEINLEFLHKCGVKVVFHSLDLEKGEANATPSIAQAMIYYLCLEGFRDDKGVLHIDDKWLKYFLEVLPHQLVNNVGVLGNIRYRTPGQSSGNPLTFQINHAVSSVFLSRLLPELRKKQILHITKQVLEDINKITGISCKVELSNNEFIAEMYEAVTTARSAGGQMGKQEKQAPILKTIKLDLLGWDAVYIVPFNCFVPVLEEDRFMKTCVFPKTTTSSVNEGDAGLQAGNRLMASFGRYLSLYLIGGWQTPGLYNALRTALSETLDSITAFSQMSLDDIINDYSNPIDIPGGESIIKAIKAVGAKNFDIDAILIKLMVPYSDKHGLYNNIKEMQPKMYGKRRDIDNMTRNVHTLRSSIAKYVRGDELDFLEKDVDAIVDSLVSLVIPYNSVNIDNMSMKNFVRNKNKELNVKMTELKETHKNNKNELHQKINNLKLKYVKEANLYISKILDTIGQGAVYNPNELAVSEKMLHKGNMLLSQISRYRGVNAPANKKKESKHLLRDPSTVKGDLDMMKAVRDDLRDRRYKIKVIDDPNRSMSTGKKLEPTEKLKIPLEKDIIKEKNIHHERINGGKTKKVDWSNYKEEEEEETQPKQSVNKVETVSEQSSSSESESSEEESTEESTSSEEEESEQESSSEDEASSSSDSTESESEVSSSSEESDSTDSDTETSGEEDNSELTDKEDISESESDEDPIPIKSIKSKASKLAKDFDDLELDIAST